MRMHKYMLFGAQHYITQTNSDYSKWRKGFCIYVGIRASLSDLRKDIERRKQGWMGELWGGWKDIYLPNCQHTYVREELRYATIHSIYHSISTSPLLYLPSVLCRIFSPFAFCSKRQEGRKGFRWWCLYVHPFLPRYSSSSSSGRRRREGGCD